MNRDGETRVLAVASGGGHWEELRLLEASFAETTVTYATTLAGLAEREALPRHFLVTDCNRNERLRSLWCLLQIAALLIRVRPHVVVSTGALPGYLAIFLGKRFGLRTIWIDSVANGEEISMAGQIARRHADLWLTQSPYVAEKFGAEYAGSVL